MSHYLYNNKKPNLEYESQLVLIEKMDTIMIELEND
jgi:hypothetical protein